MALVRQLAEDAWVRNGGDVIGSTETFLSNSPEDSALLHVTGAGSQFATTSRLTVGPSNRSAL